MSLPVTPEVMERIINGGENIAKVAAGSASELTSEAINLFIITSTLAILKFAVVFVVFYIVKRYCDALSDGAKEKDKNVFKALKTTALILSLVYFTTASFPHLQDLSKALIAPKIFLMEKTAEFVKK